MALDFKFFPERWLVGMLAGLAAAMSGCQPEPAEAIRPVRTMVLSDLQGFEKRSFAGTSAASDAVVLSFRVSGPLRAFPAEKLGTRVDKGQLLAQIDPTDFQVAVDSAKANLARARAEQSAMVRGARPEEIAIFKAALDSAKAREAQIEEEHKRNIKLRREGVVTQAQFDESLARWETAIAERRKAEEDLQIGTKGAREEDLAAKEAEINALQAALVDAQNRLGYTTLRAPFAGTVTGAYVDNFETVQANEPIVRLVDGSKIDVTVQIPENLIGLAPRVRTAVVRFEAIPDRTFEGEVTEVGAEPSPVTRTYPVTIQIEQPEDVKIIPGMAATVSGKPDEETVPGEAQGLLVPASAIFTPDNASQSHVWVVVESESGLGQVQQTPIQTGGLTPRGIPVLKGLQPGDRIVTAGVSRLREGQKVRLIEMAEPEDETAPSEASPAGDSPEDAS